MANRAAHNQQMIGQIAYGGRMGNDPPPSLDGYTYRGAGLSQVHRQGGRHRAAGVPRQERRGLRTSSRNPELIIDPDHTLECGVADMALLGCLPFAAQDGRRQRHQNTSTAASNGPARPPPAAHRPGRPNSASLNPQKRGGPIFGAASSRLRWAFVRSTNRLHSFPLKTPSS